MATDRTQLQLQHDLEQALGTSAAAALLERLPMTPAADLATTTGVLLVRDELKSEIGEVKTDVAVLKTDVAVLKIDVAVLKVDMRAVKADVAELKTDVSDLRTDMNRVVGELGGLRGELGGLRGEIGELRGAIDAQLPRLILAMVATLATLTAFAGGVMALVS